MTDSQSINSSVLAEYLDVLKQMQNSLAEYKIAKQYDYDSTQAYLARAMDTQLSSLIPNCDALRALVAEQEQADEYANSQLCPKCRGCGETAPWNSECSFQCEVCKGDGMVPIEQEQA